MNLRFDGKKSGFSSRTKDDKAKYLEWIFGVVKLKSNKAR